jgi:hypothetical protein
MVRYSGFTQVVENPDLVLRGYRYRDNELVGLTILDVSSRTQG